MSSVWSRIVSELTAGTVVLTVGIVALVGLSGGVASGAQPSTPTPTPTAPAPTPSPTPVADLPPPPPPVLEVTPASPVAAGTTSTLTATVSREVPFPLRAGHMSFLDGTTQIGDPVPVSGGSGPTTAASITTVLAPGTHTLTALIFQDDPYTPFPTSRSAAVTYVVNAPSGAKATTTTLIVVPNPAVQDLPLVLFATVAPRRAAGTVQFTDGTTPLGAPVPVVGGVAFLITMAPAAGSHTLTAVFSPANPDILRPSTSPPVALTVNPFSPS